MVDRRRRRTLLVQIVVAVLVTSLVAIGAVTVFLGQKQSERNAYAAVRAGPACHAVGAPPAFVKVAALKRLSIGAASFGYVRGDAECTLLRPGLMHGDEERLVCTFDHPGFVEARTPGGQAVYVVPYGQAVLVAEPHGPRCAVHPSL